MGCNERIELKFVYDTASICSNDLWFFQNFSFATSPIIALERYRNENNELIIRTIHFLSCNELIEWIIYMNIHPTDASIQPQWLDIWDKQPELKARCLVGYTEWEFALQNVVRLNVSLPFSYYYCFLHLSIYWQLPSFISL